jgi:hypothetical protein
VNWFEQAGKERATWEVRNERKGKQEQKTRKTEQNRSERMKAQRVEHRNANDFLALPAQSKIPSKWLFRHTRRLISHFPNDFRSLSHKRVSMSCFLLSSGFGLPSLALSCSCSAVSVVTNPFHLFQSNLIQYYGELNRKQSSIILSRRLSFHGRLRFSVLPVSVIANLFHRF